MKSFSLLVLLVGMSLTLTSASAHDSGLSAKKARASDYNIVPVPRYQYEFPTDSGNGAIKALLDNDDLGTKGIEVAEIFIPAGYESQSHGHGLEIFYILEGELHHIVNGKTHILKPGMIGVVRAPDSVIHKTSADKSVRALIIWPKGEELDGLGNIMTRVPLQ